MQIRTQLLPNTALSTGTIIEFNGIFYYTIKKAKAKNGFRPGKMRVVWAKNGNQSQPIYLSFSFKKESVILINLITKINT